MKLQTKINIKAPKEKIWEIITDIENADSRISGIDKIEILKKPESGFKGFKWKETRTLFGKTATEVMWVTDVKDNESYRTRAESHGMVYLTDVYISSLGDQNFLHQDFEGIAQTFVAKIMTVLTGFLFKSATKKAVMKDIEDLKIAAES